MRQIAILLVFTCFSAPRVTDGAIINEIFFDSPSTDNAYEFFELRGTPGESLSGLTFVVIEGDGGNAGTIDMALNLSAFNISSSAIAGATYGLFLWRDAATNLSPGPDPAVNVADGSRNNSDFNPDIENNSNTFLLVSGYSGMSGTDYDVDNDGIFDSTPWTSVVDAVSFLDGGVTDIEYATGLGGNSLLQGVGTGGKVLFRHGTTTAWFSALVNGTNPGPYGFNSVWNPDGSAAGAFFGSAVSAGFANAVPEPSGLVMISLGGLVLCGASRRRQRSKTLPDPMSRAS